MITDMHTHCFPDKLAPKALGILSKSLGGVKPYANGTVADLKKYMAEAGVGRSVIASIATNAHQMQSVNNFAKECMDNNSELVGFGSVHPDAPDVMEELERIKSLGLKGIKFHPEFQGFFVDEERMKPIYKKISELGLPILFHAGLDGGFDYPYKCMPENLIRASKWIDTPIIAAHWGGNLAYDKVIELICGTDIYIDTAMGYSFIPKPVAERIVKLHGADKILFGSDCPWHTPLMEKDFLEHLDITDVERSMIMEENADKILK